MNWPKEIRAIYFSAKVLSHSTHLIHGPVSEHRFTVNITLTNRPKVAAVVGQAAMISQHEITIGRNHNFSIRSFVLVGPRHVLFVDRFTVHKHASRVDLDVVAGQTNDSFDKTLRGVSRITEDDDIAALDRL